VQKIPTVFIRDPNDMRRVTPHVTPGCEWVLAGEGEATRKIDGTCVMLDDDKVWWARREVKPGKHEPRGFVRVEHDPVTGKTVGWEPVEQSAFAKFHAEALVEAADTEFTPGTYELIGPKINRNPERMTCHVLVSHDDTDRIKPFSLSFEGIRDTCVQVLKPEGIEGIVWHHPDGRMAKIKVRDFA
jgi:hypothetical protein